MIIKKKFPEENKTAYYIGVFEEVHGNKYRYDLVKNINIKNNRQKIPIICPKHGVFYQTVKNHAKGQGCPECGKIKKNKKISDTLKKKKRKVKEIFPPTNIKFVQDIVNPEYKKCKICGRLFSEHTQEEYEICRHYQAFPKLEAFGFDKNKIGTPAVFYEYNRIKRKIQEKYLKREITSHSTSNLDKILRSLNIPSLEPSIKNRLHKEKILINLKNLHPEYRFVPESLPDYPKIDQDKIEFYCPEHGKQKMTIISLLRGRKCAKCTITSSSYEKELKLILKEMGLLVEEQFPIPQTRYKIDLYLPKHNIGIDIHGLYYHSNKFVNKNYHKERYSLSKKHGIKLLQIFEDEWLYKKEIVIGIIKNYVGLIKTSIGARKTYFKPIDYPTAKEFHEKFHIAGSVPSKYNFGLFYQDTLVAVMSFNPLRPIINTKNYGKPFEHLELTRFTVPYDIKVVGGLSRLYKNSINYLLKKLQTDYLIITTFIDLRYFDGYSFQKIGFSPDKETDPNYYYVVNNKRVHRFNLSKHRLAKMFPDLKSLSEKEITDLLGVLRVYDAGHLRMRMIIDPRT